MIDSHVHVVSEDEEAYPRLAAAGTNASHTSRTLDAESLLELADRQGVAKLVLVQAFAAYSFDNRYVADSAARFPDRFVSVCGVDPFAEDAGATARRWIRAGARGLRVLALPADFDLARLRPVFEAASDGDVAVCLLATAPVLARLGGVVSEHPGVPVVLDHCGLQVLNSERDDLGSPALCELADVASVHLKISSRVFGNTEGATPKLVARLAARFGADRIMWGSDFPASPVASYAVAIEQAQAALAELSASARAKILHETSERVWRLGPTD